MIRRRSFLQSVFTAAALPSLPAATGNDKLPSIWVTLDTAEVKTDGNRLRVSTSRVEREWKWTGHGLVTVSFRNLHSGREWASEKPAFGADWDWEHLTGKSGSAVLKSLTATPVRFDPFTSDHIEVVAGIEYPAAKLALEYVIWVYPDAPGIRTQLRVKGLRGYTGAGAAARVAARADYVPVVIGKATRRAIGYYNDTQHRNKPGTEILREEVAAGPLTGTETYDWASILCLEQQHDGLAMVKESHKCVNQPGVDTGAFRCSQKGVANTGWGVRARDILTSRFRACWANWLIAYSGGADERELAIKVFDRKRFPVDAERDIYIMANTWGSGASGAECKRAAREANVLRQIQSCRDLGIDVQQIDDGWQGNQYKKWVPDPGRYPDGWKRVRPAARKAGVKLGLWTAWTIDEKSLLKTYDDGGFNYYKIDFSVLDTYGKLESLMEKVHRLIRHSGQTVRVNWDVTEHPPRIGYYYGRDLGNIYLENRKTGWPPNAVYIPYLVLRDAWQVARYTNLNKFQITVQNIERVSREASNAYLYNHPYAVAISLMGSPIFFQETSYYDERARQQIRPLMAVYKRHRERMYRGYVFPIGEKPNDGSWCGFQNHDPKTASGYLTIFRELRAPNYTDEFRLRFLAGRKLLLRDLLGGKQWTVSVSPEGKVAFRIDTPAGFLFLRYEVA